MAFTINKSGIQKKSTSKRNPIGLFLGLFILMSVSCLTNPKGKNIALPKFMIGVFEDDYGVSYKIERHTIHLLPNDKYHVIQVNLNERYLILQNDSLNQFAASLYSRVDFQQLENMNPFKWAFCFSNYEAESVEDALITDNIDKSNLKKGCNGFPFSRMKKR